MYFNSDQTEMNAAEKNKKKTDEGDLPSHIFNIANYLAFYRYTKKTEMISQQIETKINLLTSLRVPLVWYNSKYCFIYEHRNKTTHTHTHVNSNWAISSSAQTKLWISH